MVASSDTILTRSLLVHALAASVALAAACVLVTLSGIARTVGGVPAIVGEALFISLGFMFLRVRGWPARHSQHDKCER